ncbi:hypothetical protein QJS04_geneDACA003313 [Acorus gramineus]|uniref:BSD domain-containing protein n=1 Tax=Acorus gramineus TaxID=55184 RepID=A0AAV9BR80_ACOGR|nr:hypothetical protein QJS04_geneDACA003313 [Acorus gramineus]
MDFFKSVFFTDQDEPEQDPEQVDQQEEDDQEQTEVEPSNPHESRGEGGGGAVVGWGGLGGLIKTFASTSETVIQTYRRDLEEFRSGLKKETEIIKEAASRAVKDLPVSIEAGASVAQGSLESVGQAIDALGSSVSDILFQSSPLDEAFADGDPSESSSMARGGGGSRQYSRFDAMVMSIQSDPATFSEDPEDVAEYQRWIEGFSLEGKEGEIGELMGEEGGVLEGMYERLVPEVVDDGMFWRRYFYRLHKLRVAEDARANLVKRAIAMDDEEDLSWEVDDDDEGVNGDGSGEDKGIGGFGSSKGEEVLQNLKLEENEEPVTEKVVVSESSAKDKDVLENDEMAEEKRPLEDKDAHVGSDSEGLIAAKSEEKVAPLVKVSEHGDSCKDSDVSIVSHEEEDDLGWDEIEDIGSIDEKKPATGETPIRVDLHKRLSIAEDDEDLSWDVEDDDTPLKT